MLFSSLQLFGVHGRAWMFFLSSIILYLPGLISGTGYSSDPQKPLAPEEEQTSFLGVGSDIQSAEFSIDSSFSSASKKRCYLRDLFTEDEIASFTPAFRDSLFDGPDSRGRVVPRMGEEFFNIFFTLGQLHIQYF